MKTIRNNVQCQGNSVFQCQEVKQAGWRHCSVPRALTVQAEGVTTVEFSFLLPTERLKLHYLLAGEDELNSSSASQNNRAQQIMKILRNKMMKYVVRARLTKLWVKSLS